MGNSVSEASWERALVGGGGGGGQGVVQSGARLRVSINSSSHQWQVHAKCSWAVECEMSGANSESSP